jgi:L-fucose mutarotase/ribose pyranase (RbsD/FucU family)
MTLKNYLLMLSLLAFTACGSNGEQKAEDHTGHDHAKAEESTAQETTKAKVKLEVPTFDITKIEKTQIASLIKPYLSLKDAFVASNVTETQKLAGELATSITNEVLASVKADAEKIKQATDIEVQRESFYQLSAKMFVLVKTIGGNKQALHQQYCPMAFNDQGAYWLSDKTEIRNPYFGDAMLTCGMINESLAVK